MKEYALIIMGCTLVIIINNIIMYFLNKKEAKQNKIINDLLFKQRELLTKNILNQEKTITILLKKINIKLPGNIIPKKQKKIKCDWCKKETKEIELHDHTNYDGTYKLCLKCYDPELGHTPDYPMMLRK